MTAAGVPGPERTRAVAALTRQPVLLDMCCKAGGAAKGYAAAGFHVIGVDVEPQPRYPYEFHQADALAYPLDGADAVHWSPPCQKWALASRYNGREYPDLIGPARQRMAAAAVPWVIENVPATPLRPDIKLCGCFFGLEEPGVGQLMRERWFETSWRASVRLPGHDHHAPAISVAGHGTPAWQRRLTGHVPVAVWRKVMGIGWMTRQELTEAIPPAYGLFMGRLLMERVRRPAKRQAGGEEEP